MVLGKYHHEQEIYSDWEPGTGFIWIFICRYSCVVYFQMMFSDMSFVVSKYAYPFRILDKST